MRAILGHVLLHLSERQLHVVEFARRDDQLKLLVESRETRVVVEVIQHLNNVVEVLLVQLEVAVADVEQLDGFEQDVVDEDELFFGLHEKVSLLTNVLQERRDVQCVLLANLLEHRVDDDVRARAAHTRGAVHNDGAARLGIAGRRTADEGENRQGKQRHAMVGPVGVMKLMNQSFVGNALRRRRDVISENARSSARTLRLALHRMAKMRLT